MLSSARVPTNETVEVLLATFNGERFLREQIDSVLAQDYPNLRVVARDDGSSDGTAAILKEYQERFADRVRVLPTDRPTGSPKWNFLRLMEAAKADYVCFCDQDDVWHPDKVSTSMKAMRDLESKWGSSMPCLVFTDLQVVDAELRLLYKSFWQFMKIQPADIHRLNRLLMVCVVTGCTAMINRPLLELSKRVPAEASMHDRWVGLIAASMGKSSIIRNPTVLYRQHGRNLLGTGRDLTGNTPPVPSRPLLTKISRYEEGATYNHWREAQEHAAAFLQVYGSELNGESKCTLEAFRRCDVDDSSLVRLLTVIRYRFYVTGIIANLAKIPILWTRNLNSQTR